MSGESAPVPLDDVPSLQAGHRKLEQGHRDIKLQVAALALELKANTDATKRIDENTAGMVLWMNNFEGAFNVLAGIGKLAKPLAIIAAAVISVSAAVTLAWLALKGWVGFK